MNEHASLPAARVSAGPGGGHSRPLTLKRALLTFLILPLMPLTIWLDATFSALFNVTELWPGFLFVAAWMTTGRVDFASYASSTAAALLGIALGLLLQVLPVKYGQDGLIAAGSVISAFVYLLMIGKARFAVNSVTMIFLTVCTIPWIKEHTPLSAVMFETLVGSAFFGGLILGHKSIASLIGRWLAARK